MKNNNTKTILNNNKNQNAHLNVLKAQLRNKLLEIGIVFNQAPREIQAYKNTLINKDKTHRKVQVLPNMYSLRSRQFLSDQFKDKIQPKYPEIFSYRACKGLKPNLFQMQKRKYNANNRSQQKFQPFSPQSLGECIRHKIIQQARNHAHTQSAIASKELNRQKLARLSGPTNHSITVKKVKDVRAKDGIYNELHDFRGQISKLNAKIRSKTQQNRSKPKQQIKIDTTRVPITTLYRNITPWQQNKVSLDQYQQYF